jgi:hypothetical protein
LTFSTLSNSTLASLPSFLDLADMDGLNDVARVRVDHHRRAGHPRRARPVARGLSRIRKQVAALFNDENDEYRVDWKLPPRRSTTRA